MILTVTLNPAIDKTYRVEKIMTGQVNRIREVDNFAGGKGINVAKILKQLGEEVTATGFLGGYAGTYINDSLCEKQIICDFITVEGETRSNINILGDDGYITEILEPGPMIREEHLNQLYAEYVKLLRKTDMVVLSGSVTCGVPTDIYSILIHSAQQYSVPVILDSSGEYLREGVGAMPYMIKPNRKELEILTGFSLRSIEQVAEAAKIYCSRGINKVVVSMGSQGMICADCEGILHAIPPIVKEINTVGCGDSIVAVYAANVGRMSREDCIRYATAVSAANVTTVENGDIDMEVVEELYQRVQVREIRD